MGIQTMSDEVYIFPALPPPGQPTHRDEPISISAALAAPSLAEYIAAAARDYPSTPLGICQHCGSSLGDKPEDKVIPIGAFGFLPNVCCQACSDKGKKRLAEEEAKERARAFGAFVPAEFVWWDEKRGNNAALAAARGKFNPATRRGLILHGGSGSCKTRIMWELVKSIAQLPNPPTWAWLDSYDAATTGFPADASKAEFLFLDDLGNEPTSTKFETALLRILRRRNDWHQPIFISTQLTGEQFKSRFFQGPAAVAILRRLSERTDKIATDL